MIKGVRYFIDAFCGYLSRFLQRICHTVIEHDPQRFRGSAELLDSALQIILHGFSRCFCRAITGFIRGCEARQAVRPLVDQR